VEIPAELFGGLSNRLRDLTIVFGFCSNIDFTRMRLAHLVDVHRLTIRYQGGGRDGREVHISPPNIEELLLDWTGLDPLFPPPLKEVCDALKDWNRLSSLRHLALCPSSSRGFRNVHYYQVGGRILRWDGLEELKTICNTRGVSLDVHIATRLIV
jgi:hypothetical protein